MIKVLRKIVLVAFLALFTNVVNGATENGITRTDSDFRHYDVAEYVFFNDYDPGTATMVYNGAGDSGASDGWVAARRYMTSKDIHIQVPTLGSSWVWVDIYGRSGTDTGEYLIYRFATDTATTQDTVIPIGENPDDIRIGLQNRGTDGADLITVTGTFMGRE